MPITHTLPVSLAHHSYNILIGQGLLPTLPHQINALFGSKKPRCFIITDSHVASLHLAAVEQVLNEGGYAHHAVVIPAGEQSKSFSTLESVLDQLFTHQPERSSLLIALGGGVVGDLTGFTASILLRGVPFIQIPTTLLAQVDSSVGGKTGINNRFGKNLIGTFYQPHLVLADLALLSSLPQRELLSGYAEVAKYGLINQPDFFAWLEAHSDAIRQRDPETLTHCIHVSCKTKAAIVAEDEKEGGVRALLNLGHTFAHALEAETGYSNMLLHGEAVAIGMVLAFQLSVQLGYCPEEDAKRVKNHLSAIGLPTSLADIPVPLEPEKLLSHMYQDKKVQQGKLVFILAKGIGLSFIAKEVNAESVIAVLEKK